MDGKERGYNGFRNHQTWNVALWIGNDEGWYGLARTCKSYSDFRQQMDAMGVTETPDGVSLTARGLDRAALTECIKEL